MSFLWVGTSIDQMVITGDVRDVAQTSDTYCDIRIQATDGAGNYADTPDLGVNLRNHWYGFRHVNDMASTTSGRRNIAWELVDASGIGVVRVFRAGSVGTNDVFQYWNGSAWANVGSAGAVVNYSGAKIDIYAKLDASGELSFYKDGTLQFQETGDFSGYASPRAMRHGRYQAGNNSGTMEMMIADEDTRGIRYSYDVPTGNGANTDWTNDYTAVDETVLDNTDGIFSSSAGDRETVTSENRNAKLNGKTIKAVVVSFCGAKSPSGPSQVETMLRIGSTNYDFGADHPLYYGFKGFQHLWTTDPSTGLPWDPADAEDAALEYGVKSVT